MLTCSLVALASKYDKDINVLPVVWVASRYWGGLHRYRTFMRFEGSRIAPSCNKSALMFRVVLFSLSIVGSFLVRMFWRS